MVRRAAARFGVQERVGTSKPASFRGSRTSCWLRRPRSAGSAVAVIPHSAPAASLSTACAIARPCPLVLRRSTSATCRWDLVGRGVLEPRSAMGSRKTRPAVREAFAALDFDVDGQTHQGCRWWGVSSIAPAARQGRTGSRSPAKHRSGFACRTLRGSTAWSRLGIRDAWLSGQSGAAGQSPGTYTPMGNGLHSRRSTVAPLSEYPPISGRFLEVETCSDLIHPTLTLLSGWGCGPLTPARAAAWVSVDSGGEVAAPTRRWPAVASPRHQALPSARAQQVRLRTHRLLPRSPEGMPSCDPPPPGPTASYWESPVAGAPHITAEHRRESNRADAWSRLDASSPAGRRSKGEWAGQARSASQWESAFTLSRAAGCDAEIPATDRPKAV